MTIKDIARAANVSAATVSRIINHKDENISQETRERVLRVIEENDYVPYAKIRERIFAQTRSLGLVIPTFHSAFYVRLASEIQQLAQENSYSLMLALSGGSPEADLATLENFTRNHTDGVMIVSGSEQALGMLKQMHDQGTAVVALGHYYKPGNLPQLYRDSRQIAQECTRLLLKSNCAKVGLVLRPDCSETLQEVIASGYRNALTQTGGVIRQNLIVLGNENFQDSFRVMCDSGLDGVVCQDADMAASVYAAAARDGLRIPEDLSVVSMEDAPDAAFRTPALTCASTDITKMAQLVFSCVLSQINHAPAPFSALQLECPIVARDSVCPRKSTQPQVLVAGYISTDILLQTPEVPKIGKTQIASHMADFTGGKGANQAYGIGKLGGNVSLLGVVGSDRRGRSAYEHLFRAGVKMEGVSFLPELPTGAAYISLCPDGNTSVLIDPGANAALNSEYIRRYESLVQKADICLAQTDISIECVMELSRLCRKHRIPVVLSCSYGVPVPEPILEGVAILIIKDEEREKLYPQFTAQEDCAQYLLGAGARNVIFVSGVSGCFFANKNGSRVYPGYDYPSIDQTGTSDVFAGCLVFLLTEGVALEEAIGAAAWAAAYSTTRLGVQPGFPGRNLLEDVCRKHLQLTFPELSNFDQGNA